MYTGFFMNMYICHYKVIRDLLSVQNLRWIMDWILKFCNDPFLTALLFHSIGYIITLPSCQARLALMSVNSGSVPGPDTLIIYDLKEICDLRHSFSPLTHVRKCFAEKLCRILVRNAENMVMVYKLKLMKMRLNTIQSINQMPDLSVCMILDTQKLTLC